MLQLGEDVEGVQAVGEVVHVAGEDQFVRFGLLQQLFQALAARLASKRQQTLGQG